MSDALHSGILHAAQISAIHAREILEVVQVLLHSVEDGDPGLSHSRCSGGYEIVELACSHLDDIQAALAKAVEAVEAGARS